MAKTRRDYLDDAYTALGVAYKALGEAFMMEKDRELFAVYVGAKNLRMILSSAFNVADVIDEPKPAPKRFLEDMIAEAVDKSESVSIVVNRNAAHVTTTMPPCEVRSISVRAAVTTLLKHIRSAA
jgi:hypothetical protein